jgi:hypothetical protein
MAFGCADGPDDIGQRGAKGKTVTGPSDREWKAPAVKYQPAAAGGAADDKPSLDRSVVRSRGRAAATAASRGGGQRRIQVLTLDAETLVVARCPRWVRVSRFEQIGQDNDATLADGKS